jgi:hypothetical protein
MGVTTSLFHEKYRLRLGFYTIAINMKNARKIYI